MPTEINTLSPESSSEDTWEKIANLKFTLKPGLSFHQHCYRGNDWAIIADDSSESYFRCSIEVQPFLEMLNGQHSLQSAYQATIQNNTQNSDELLEKDKRQKEEVLNLLANLKSANLLNVDQAEQKLAESNKQKQKKLSLKSLLRPFSIRLSILDPDKILTKTAPVAARFFNTKVLLLWFLVIGFALLTAWHNASALSLHWHSRFTDPQNILLMTLIYPVIKLFHELGHAFATKVWGGAVHDMGIMFLVFFPVPYVDSSAASRFQSKNQRIIVGSIGILIEVFIAAVAIIIWSQSESQLVRDICFNAAFIGGVSTLLFNGNPLLRFDAYYILADAIEIPNLATRSSQYLGYLFKRYILQIHDSLSPVTATGERAWFIFYGIAAAVYRLFITLLIALWIAGKFFIIGVLLAVWAVVLQIILPIYKQLQRLIPVAAAAGKLLRLGVVATAVLLVMTVVLFIPVPNSTYAEGIISLPEHAYVRAKTSGMVLSVLPKQGDAMQPGEPIMQLENLSLTTELAVLQSRLIETRVRENSALAADNTQGEIFKLQRLTIARDIASIEDQLASLVVKSPTAGRWSRATANSLLGHYVNKGDVLGYVTNFSQVSAQLVIAQQDIDLVRHQSQHIAVKLRSQPEQTLTAKMLRAVPLATNQLPSRFLGTASGGYIAVDARDNKGLQTLSNVFLVEIELPPKLLGNYLGQRVAVRFSHGQESIINQLNRSIQQWFLAEFTL